MDSHPIRAAHCAPVPRDNAIESEKPVLGQPLASVLSWRRQANPAGRDHKWGLVLETIHYALHRQGQNG